MIPIPFICNMCDGVGWRSKEMSYKEYSKIYKRYRDLKESHKIKTIVWETGTIFFDEKCSTCNGMGVK